jgi:hypothetical protein
MYRAVDVERGRQSGFAVAMDLVGTVSRWTGQDPRERSFYLRDIVAPDLPAHEVMSIPLRAAGFVALDCPETAI